MESAIIAVHNDNESELIDIKGELVNEDLSSIGKLSIYEYLKSAIDQDDLICWPSSSGIYKISFKLDNFACENDQDVFISNVSKIDNIDNIIGHYYL
jgi:hypothetical protein